MSERRKALLIAPLGCGALLLACGVLGILAVLFGNTPLEIEEQEPEQRTWETAVWIVIDDLRADHLKCYGYELDTTPNITRLAERGVVFTDFVTASTATNPAVASLLTGSYPAQHGVTTVRDVGRHRLPASVPTLPGILSEAGCATIAAVSLRQLEGRLSGFDRGFDVYLDAGLPRNGRAKPAAEVAAALAPELRRMLDGDAPVFAFVHFGDLRLESDRDGGKGAARFLRTHLDPFVEQSPLIEAALSSLDPVAELERSIGRRRGSPEWVAFREALYDARLYEVDRAVGEIFDVLADSGRYGNAWVEVLGTRGRYLTEDRPDGPQEGFSEVLVRTARVASGTGSAGWTLDAVEDGADPFWPLVTVFGIRPGFPDWWESEVACVSGPGLRECAVIDATSKVVFPLRRPDQAVTFERTADRGLGAPPSDVWRVDALRVAPRFGVRIDVGAGLERGLDVRVVTAERDVLGIEVLRGEGRVDSRLRTGTAELRFEPGDEACAVLLATATRDPHLLLELTSEDGAWREEVALQGVPLPDDDAPEGGEAIVDVRRVQGSWFELSVAGEGGSARAYVVRHPPKDGLHDLENEVTSVGGRALWSAGGIGGQVFEGPLPLRARFRMGPLELPGVAVEIDGVRVPVAGMRFQGRAFAGRTLRVVLPKWLPSRDDWFLGDGGGVRPERESALAVTRLASGARMEGPLDLEPDDVAFLQRLGANE